jgi:hypothetical protein
VGCAPDGPAKRFWVLGRYRLETFLRILGIVDLRPLRGRHAYKALLEVGSTRLLTAMLGNQGVFTSCPIKTMT